MYTKDLKIGIIGSGVVGQVLATAFLTEGHKVMLGSRNTQKEEVVKWKSNNAGAQTGTFDEVAIFGDVLVLATQGEGSVDAVQLAGPENLSGKTVIDTCNPISSKAHPVNGVLQYFTGPNSSLMETLQLAAPGAHFVKAFNSAGNAVMYKPQFEAGRPSMFICGNNAEAKETVTTILDIFGWDTEDMGNEEAARAIEPLCMLWCIPGLKNNQWTHAFKLLKK